MLNRLHFIRLTKPVNAFQWVLQGITQVELSQLGAESKG